MSRSVKKHPCCLMATTKSNKKIANRKVRNTVEIYNGNSYKKLYNSWNIVDFKDTSTRSKCSTLTDNEYKKYFVRK